MGKRIGNQTATLSVPVPIAGFASLAGRKEGQAPLTFDYVLPDATFGEKTWEKAESRMQHDVLERAMAKAGVSEKELEIVCAGDLINQCIASAFGTRGREVGFLGLYGAC